MIKIFDPIESKGDVKSSDAPLKMSEEEAKELGAKLVKELEKNKEMIDYLFSEENPFRVLILSPFIESPINAPAFLRDFLDKPVKALIKGDVSEFYKSLGDNAPITERDRQQFNSVRAEIFKDVKKKDNSNSPKINIL